MCNIFYLRRLRISDEERKKEKNATNEIFLLNFCGHDAGFAMYPKMSKGSIVTCVYQHCLLAFTKFISLCRLGSPCHGVTISRFKIGFESIKVQVNG